MKKTKSFATLTTKYEENIGSIPYSEYPRPNMVRESYISLNGEWSLRVTDKGEECFFGTIIVPFPPESKVSGVCRQFPFSSVLEYERSFALPSGFMKDRLILHFGAVDRYAEVLINGQSVGSHDGGYLPFSFDITDYINDGENKIMVKVLDDLDTDYPYGKQSKKRGGMWYTPISGIWQSVWLESVCDKYIRKMSVMSDMSSVTLTTIGGEYEKKLTVHTDGGDLVYEYSGDSITVNTPNARLWSPDDPYLYRFTIESGKDRVKGYYAHREISIEKHGERQYICLNRKPIFMNGLLDQGYFSDGIYLPATPDGYRDDILSMKRLGFNTLRKHIKIEPPLFYYYCDLYGMIVWQDMINSGKYSFILDTALPTVLLRRGMGHRASKKRRDIFENTAKETIELLRSFPSVCYYTVFNEGWGQYDADRIYRELKEIDPSRVYDATSGWFKKKESDVESEHIYFKPVKLKSDSRRPLVLSEFGGYSLKVEGHSFNLEENYGYKSFDSSESLTEGLRSLYIDQIVPSIKKGLCGAILTQVSDVEDETNGLLTYDRQVMKVDEGVIKTINETLYKTFDEILSE